ncbi:3-oxoadipate enol-lactonase [Rhizobium halophilum]|uniref:3-oxoadipate enol-lactonase n=1 Tax=Rhizobium halophilum TaxID=2846852 RepID=UPI001EFCBFCF|nr:3-oxoadipate enol-lactonase [Rhizobium halophilum]MCF6370270.1 3-oxoadipate enol-lactonase [Rhizobium halophilum]
MQFVRINAVTIAYQVTATDPDNPVLVLINSLGTDSRIWHLVVPKLAEDFTVVTYDKRGHGLSDLASPPYGIGDHVADLVGLLDHLEYSDVVLCGLSVGGLVAQGLYAQRPDLVKAMVLADTAHKIGTPEMWNKRIAAIEDGGIASILDDIMVRWFTEPFRRPDNAAYSAYCNMLLRQPTQGYTGTCAAIRDADFTEEARTIRVPVLCVVGDQDGSTPPDLVRSLANLIPGAQYEVIEGAAHIPCAETPAAFAAAVRSFIINDVKD